MYIFYVHVIKFAMLWFMVFNTTFNNIGVLMVSIEFIWRGLEMGERRALASLSIHFVPSHINSIFTVNTPILYYLAIKFTKKKVI